LPKIQALKGFLVMNKIAAIIFYIIAFLVFAASYSFDILGSGARITTVIFSALYFFLHFTPQKKRD